MLRLTQKQLDYANGHRKYGGCEISVGKHCYFVFGTEGVTLNYPKRSKNEVKLLGKHVNEYYKKTLKEINSEFTTQEWQ